jgi:hypothetical protein
MGPVVSSLVFQPPMITYMHTAKHFWLKNRYEQQIPAFFIDRSSPVTILFSHGNAEDLGMIHDWFYDFSRNLNVNVLAYDYCGYGKSSGSVSEVRASISAVLIVPIYAHMWPAVRAHQCCTNDNGLVLTARHVCVRSV